MEDGTLYGALRLSRRALLRALLVAGVGAGAVAPLMAACGTASRPNPRPAGAGAAAPPSTSVVVGTPPAHVALVRFAWWTDVGELNPFQVSVSGPGGAVLLTLIYDTLTWKSATGIIPWLGTKWEAASDGLSYTFSLVNGARWHDGEPLTPDDVAFSFSYYTGHPYKWTAAPMIASATVEGEQVTIALKNPYAPFLDEIAGILPIVPRHVWQAIDDPIKAQQPNRTIGSGPFVLADHDAAQGAYRLAANPSYWRGRVRVGEWRQITVPANARVEVVQQGDADISLSTDASVVDLLKGNKRLTIFEGPPLSMVRLVINTTKAPLDQQVVRQAIAYALDRKQIAETVTHGPAIVGNAGVVPPETPWYDPNVRQYSYDPEKARALLGGKQYSLRLIAETTAREPELMAPMLQAIGITLEVQRVDAATETQLLSQGDFELALTSHIGVGGDPDYLRRWYSGEAANAFAQGGTFNDPQYAKLGREEAAELDPAKRRTIIFQMEEILADQLPTIVLYHRRFYWIYDPSRFQPLRTWGGLMDGIPFPNNKLTLIESWGQP